MAHCNVKDKAASQSTMDVAKMSIASSVAVRFSYVTQSIYTENISDLTSL